MGAAVTKADLLFASLPSFRRLVARTEARIEEAIEKVGFPIGASTSGGKDSLVLYDMLKRQSPECRFGFFDSGGELPQTEEWIDRHPDVVRVPTRHNFYDMLRWGGYWGYRGPDLQDLALEFNFDRILVDEPAARFIEQFNLKLVFIGLRSQESAGRRMNHRTHGWLYYAKYAHAWHCTPLFDWTHDDVWAYIASRELDYNTAYDVMTEAGIPRAQQRVSIVLGSVGANLGRLAWLRRIAPGLWNRLAAEFPKIRQYT